MIQQTNTNSIGGNSNCNPNVRRDKGRGQRDFGGCGGHSGCRDCRNNNTIAKLSFEGKLKDGCLYKLTITEDSHQATQLKKIRDALPILYVNKSYKYIEDVICNNKELIKANHMPTYPDHTRWLNLIMSELTRLIQTVQ